MRILSDNAISKDDVNKMIEKAEKSFEQKIYKVLAGTLAINAVIAFLVALVAAM